MKARGTRWMWVGIGVVLLALGAWLIVLGLGGLAYMREAPTMSDGSVAKVQLGLGGVLMVAALVSGWRVARAPRD